MSKEPSRPTHDEGRVIADVWSRTEPKYRRRAVILLLINVCLFSGLGCVAYWLRTGIVFAPRMQGYSQALADTFNPTLDNEYTPIGLSLGPISVESVPMMVPVLGLILAALVSIPILITILYRLPCALPFIAVVGFIAVMPWLAIALTVSCLLISLSPMRIRSRFAGALFALVPVVIYFFMASRQASSAVADLTNPADRIKLLAPLILAVIASAIFMGVVLIIAHIVKYRPGAVAPLLAAMFLAPAAMFEFQVGRDELHYSLLEQRYGPGSEYFVSRSIAEEFDRAVEKTLARQFAGGMSYEDVRDKVELKWLLALDDEAELLFTRYKDSAARAADRFVLLFPGSIYAPSAKYIEGRALDMNVDVERFREKRELVFYDDFPSARSRRAWELIEHLAPDSPPAAVALLRLARLDARAGEVDQAIDRLNILSQRFGTNAFRTDEVTTSKAINAIMQRDPPEKGLDISIAQQVTEGRKLLGLLDSNRDPLWGDAPIVVFLSLDPRDPLYAKNLNAIAERFPACQLADNLELYASLAVKDIEERAEMLAAIVSEHGESDAFCEALFQLGVARQSLRQAADSRTAYEHVVQNCSESVWREQAESRMRQLDRTATEGV